LHYELSPAPEAVFRILGATTLITNPVIDPDESNIRATAIEREISPAGPVLDIRFHLNSPEIKTLQIAQQEKNLVLVFGPWPGNRG